MPLALAKWPTRRRQRECTMNRNADSPEIPTVIRTRSRLDAAYPAVVLCSGTVTQRYRASQTDGVPVYIWHSSCIKVIGKLEPCRWCKGTMATAAYRIIHLLSTKTTNSYWSVLREPNEITYTCCYAKLTISRP